MTHADRTQLIASYAAAPDMLEQALPHFPREMWQYRYAPDQWTIHEILVHLTDSETNSYVRLRRLLAEPGSPVLGYDQNGWAVALKYHAQDADLYVRLFRILREASVQLLQLADAAAFDTATIVHSERGVMTFDQWLQGYERHTPGHIRQMQRVYDHWVAAGKPAVQ